MRFWIDAPAMTLADRVWLAYWSLPRGPRKRPPSYKKLEESAGLPNGILSKLITEERKGATPDTLALLAQALRVEPGWLAWGTGTPPTPTGTVPARTLETSEAVEDSGEVSALHVRVSAEVRRSVTEAVDRALHEAEPDAAAYEVLAAALMHVSSRASRK
jgi:hypothetical protein